MNTLREFLSDNAFNIPPLLQRKIDEAINIAESNANEAQVYRPLRVLIQALAQGIQSANSAIQDYLDAPETQNSSTREVLSLPPPMEEAEEPVEEAEVAEPVEQPEERNLREHDFQRIQRFLSRFSRNNLE